MTFTIDSVNKLIVNKCHIIEDLKLFEETFDTSNLNKELQTSVEKMNSTKENIENLIGKTQNRVKTKLNMLKNMKN